MFKYKHKNQQIITQEKMTHEAYELLEKFDSSPVYYPYTSTSKNGVHLVDDTDFYTDQTRSLERLLCETESSLKTPVIAINEGVDAKVMPLKKSYKMHVLGLGDVGGMMLSALRLIAGDTLSEIGIFDLDDNKMQRWLYELNQIKSIDRGPFPEVKGIAFEDVFDCDVFVFTASSLIPEVGSGVTDVRMFQLEANAKIIKIYAEKAASVGFKGQFIVVSDPVDLLCKAVLDYGQGKLLAEQIKGFGLGVMHARACFYGPKCDAAYYESLGRAYGPHGKHLIIADSIENYNHAKSLNLTDKTIKANLDVRAVGYKPFIAPALSSAALSILAYLEGKPHYSTVYIEDVFFGCKNKATALNLFEVEKNKLDPLLLTRLKKTYKELKPFEF